MPDKILFESDCAFVFLPPREVFADEGYIQEYKSVQRAKLNECRIILGEDGGMFLDYYGKKYPYEGIPFPAVVNNVAIFKRFLLARARSLKNPFVLLWSNRFKEEAREMGQVCLWKYRLKPERYCRMVRELRRVGDKLFPEDTDLVMYFCSILEWDSAYKDRAHTFFGNLSNVANVNRKEISKELKNCELDDPNERLKGHWRILRFVFNALYLVSRKFRRIVKQFVKEVDFEELRPSEANLYYQNEYR